MRTVRGSFFFLENAFQLIHLFAKHPFSAPWKHQKTKVFCLVGGREKVHLEQMCHNVYKKPTNVMEFPDLQSLNLRNTTQEETETTIHRCSIKKL